MKFKGKTLSFYHEKTVTNIKKNNITEKNDSYFHKAIGVMFTQMSAKGGIKKSAREL